MCLGGDEVYFANFEGERATISTSWLYGAIRVVTPSKFRPPGVPDNEEFSRDDRMIRS